jgi:sugar/nucleoside kinase (ribokinase family)
LKHRPQFFFDLADPASRSEGDIRKMLGTLPSFERCGTTVLGLNGNEADILSRVMGLPAGGKNMPEVERQAAALRERLGISQVVIHHIRFAAVADAQGSWSMAGPHCAKPKKSTGAGDRFNAGYCCGLMLGLDPESRLAFGSAASGFFVREARSASCAELAEFIETWARGETQ